MIKNIQIVSLIAITLLVGAPAHAGIFKWVDANGLTHYSDKAPDKHSSQTLDKRGINRTQAPVSYDIELIGTPAPKTEALSNVAPEAVSDVIPGTMPDLDAIEYDLRKATQKVEQGSMSNLKTKLCTNARMQLAALQEEGHGRYFDEEGNYRLDWGEDAVYQGERHHLTDEQASELSKLASFEVEQYCANPYDQMLQDDARANWIRSEYCTVSKAYLAELEDPAMRTADSEISKQLEEVARFCAELKSSEHRGDDRYYPTALRAKQVKSNPKFSIRWH